jgi:hypothetical protein
MESPVGSGESDSRLDLLGFAGTPFLGEFGAVLDILDLGKVELKALGRLEAVEKEEELEVLDRLEAVEKEEELEALGRLEAFGKVELEVPGILDFGKLEAFEKEELPKIFDKNLVALVEDGVLLAGTVVLADLSVATGLEDFFHMYILPHEYPKLSFDPWQDPFFLLFYLHQF